MSAAVVYAMKSGGIKMGKKYGIWPKTIIVGTIGEVIQELAQWVKERGKPSHCMAYSPLISASPRSSGLG